MIAVYSKAGHKSRNISEPLTLGCGLIILLASFSLPYLKYLFDPDALIYFSSVLLIPLFIWSVWSWKTITKRLFDPYVIFLLSATLFNGGQAFLEAFQLNEYGILDGNFPPERVLKTLFLVLISLSSLHFGALISALRSKKESFNRNTGWKNNVQSLEDIRWVGWGLLFISIIPAYFLLKDAVTHVMAYGYFALFQQEAETGFGATYRILTAFIVPAALFLLAGSQGRRITIAISGIVILSYSSILFLLGSRAWAVMPLVAFLWIWHRCIRTIPWMTLLIIGGALLFIVFPLVKDIRNVAGEDRLSSNILIDAFFSIDNPAVAIISEIGGSMKTIAYTLELVPDIRPFDMGEGYLYSFLTIIPNFFWEIHPTVGRGLATDWLIQMVDPFNAFVGGSIGFSFISEAYLNFGWVGGPMVAGLIGFLFGKLVLWADASGDRGKLAMIASFSAFFPFLARGESAQVIRALLWYSFIPYACIYLLKDFRNKMEGREIT
ncbi:MAG: O-antigen polysaccharide polymerase Wzy family protein [Candidatus Helarchaeota archaeon]|nr:O-antigen polysaccharide polymerase Wzy family protein [Candidatus Helarchaeota archaeon]